MILGSTVVCPIFSKSRTIENDFSAFPAKTQFVLLRKVL